MTTVSELLFEPQADAASEIAGALARTPAALGQLSVAGISIPTVEVANAIAALLELPIGNIAIQGWKDHRSVAEARARTAASPGSREVVRLLEHRITSTQEPVIEVDVNGVSVPVLTLTLELELRLSTADVIVERGEVIETRPGSAVATGTLSASKVVLAKKELREVDLGREVQHIDLAPPPPTATAAPTAGPPAPMAPPDPADLVHR